MCCPRCSLDLGPEFRGSADNTVCCRSVVSVVRKWEKGPDLQKRAFHHPRTGVTGADSGPRRRRARFQVPVGNGRPPFECRGIVGCAGYRLWFSSHRSRHSKCRGIVGCAVTPRSGATEGLFLEIRSLFRIPDNADNTPTTHCVVRPMCL